MKILIKKAFNPLKIFISDSRFIGVLLVSCTLLSLIISNSSHGNFFRAIFNTDPDYGLPFRLPDTGLKWINDFLMAFFFLFAGMEIKRELTLGELSSFKKAILPFGAALGGMIVPALIYLSFNINSDFSHGWGIPTATDIAFSIGIASLFGKRVPGNLKILLMALAIIDDLGAIVIIALFYGNEINGMFLLIAAGIYGLLWLCNFFKIKPGIIQIALSFSLWYVIYNAGIEGSITGVLVAFAMPVNSLTKLEVPLQKIVNFFILPLFAIANTAILIPHNIGSALNSTITIGVIAGLVIGKPVGIFIFSRIMISLKIAKLPTNTNLKQLLGMGSLAGIGFTMSIFTTSLAFDTEQYKDTAKIAIIISLALSMLLSWLYFLLLEKRTIIPEYKKLRPANYPELSFN
ncbi:MAG: Na+/H+ antiporter NhaA [Parafilimonas sp.]